MSDSHRNKTLILNCNLEVKRYTDKHALPNEFDFAKEGEIQIVLENHRPLQIFLRGEPFPSFKNIFVHLWRKRLDATLIVIDALLRCNHPVSDHEVNTLRLFNKIKTAFVAQDLGFLQPKTVFVQRNFITEYIPFIESHLEYPFIMKDLKGMKGSHNFLIHSRSELLEKLSICPDGMELVFQEFIQNEFDYRFFVVKYKTRLVYKRIRPNNQTHLNNVSQGGSTEFVPLDDITHLIPPVDALCKKLHLLICGVDLLKGVDGTHYFLEANDVPGIKSFNAGEYVLEYLRSLK